MVMWTYHFRAIFWKNLILRLRHWCMTISEIIAPLFCFILVALMTSALTEDKASAKVKKVTEYAQEDILKDAFKRDNSEIYYSPSNEYFDGLVAKVGKKFEMSEKSIHGLQNEQQLVEQSAKSRKKYIFLIIFHSTAESTNLDYTVRVRETLSLVEDSILETNKLYNEARPDQPLVEYTGAGSQYLESGFVAIQMAVDISFMEMEQTKNQQLPKIVVKSQEFPYPPHKDSKVMSMIYEMVLPFSTWCSFNMIYVIMLKRIVEEKYTGIKELMKMVGVSNWVIWLGWFIHSLLPTLISVAYIVLLLKVNFLGAFPTIEFAQGTILFTFLVLYVCANITLSFFISTWTSSPNLASIMGEIVYCMTFLIPWQYLIKKQLSTSAKMSIMLMPDAAMLYGFKAITHYELGEVGAKWSNIHVAGQGEISLLYVFIMLIVDCVVYMLLTLYLDDVHPGKYGMRKSLLFPFETLRKCFKGNKKKLTVAPSRSVILKDAEKANMPKGIELKNLGKVYGKKTVVKNLSMDIYQDQITVLLGHNGAGKTTTMGMITGMIEKSSGKIIINGVEVKSRSDITKSLGLCPQENLYFRKLTVKEHLNFFATLKGQSKSESYDEIEIILRKLNMTDKENSMADKLSGGMQRKLSLAIAIVGGSKILVLDEPSSGMDPQSRRELWDMLHKWRSEKTILITTHFMEEADAIGDWIAIMNEGELVCFGTPMYLKKKYETGSNLVLLIKKDKNVKQAVQKIENLLKGQFKTAKCIGINGNEVRFFLPPGNYIKLFDYLEPNKSSYDIENISFKSTTLEDVFLSPKVTHQEEDEENVQNDLESIERTHDATCCLTLKALIYKKYRYFYRKFAAYITAIIFALLLVVACVFALLFQKPPAVGGPPLKLALSAYGETKVYWSMQNPSGLINEIYEKLILDQKSKVELVESAPESIIQAVKKNDLLYLHFKLIVASGFHTLMTEGQETIQVLAMYNCYALHSAAISFNLISNTIAQYSLGDEYSISTRNHPLIIISEDLQQQHSIEQMSSIWGNIWPLAFLVFTGCFIIFPFSELSAKFAQTQFMCGVRPFVYWLTTFFMDYLVFLLFSYIACMIIILSCYNLRGLNEFGALFLILTLYGLSAIPIAYLFARTKSLSDAFAGFIIYGILVTMFLPIVVVLAYWPEQKFLKAARILSIIFTVICPQYGLAWWSLQFALKANEIYEFTHADEKTRILMCFGGKVNPCCFKKARECDKWMSYMSVFHPNIWWMLLCAAIYFFLVLVLDLYCLKKGLNCFKNLICSHGRGRDVDSDTEAEKADHNTLRVKHIKKYYWKKRVVNDVSMSVTKGQCMGILGVNGAGKTTTFRMLTRETVVDEGAIRINANSVEDIEFLKRLGYCPQQDSLNLALTGREMLKTMAMLRGIKDDKIVDQFLDIFGLKKIANIKCEHYSGGNKRRLTFAVAVIGFPDFILLDEPTSGVDPLSRRKFWSLIKQIRDTNQNSFILTSHSLDECEAVCDDLKIMKAGAIKKEGPIAKLKTEVCGFNVMLKLDKDKVKRPQGQFLRTVPELKKYLRQKFPTGSIRDEHTGLIHYFIKTKEKKWSLLFGTFDDLKQKCELVEDYSISEASLEDVFLIVAKTEDDFKDPNEETGEDDLDTTGEETDSDDESTEDDISTEDDVSTEDDDSTEEELTTDEESTESESSS